MSHKPSRLGSRLCYFALAGTSCFLVQILILASLERFMLSVVANAIGFAVSAQLNFLMSYRLTWRDSVRKAGIVLARVWIKFNCVALGALCVNSVCFVVSKHELNAPDMIAAIAATFVSTVGTFFINHLFVLKPKGV
ncbi:putative flippase GtrA [Pseudarthrobacter sp. W1I19]|uniref:GtrA family protein n=1 Tax=Pseudarthrobacter sp. W1I19 TaxID=3042288 RepID=UPI002782B3C8|nr:GtrA family protein [Pseudarthrobacter sp. W1I19]MDQ0922359.1 putative flippase GtrA [Pseudarthrobacter sp. W1I19]